MDGEDAYLFLLIPIKKNQESGAIPFVVSFSHLSQFSKKSVKLPDSIQFLLTSPSFAFLGSWRNSASGERGGSVLLSLENRSFVHMLGWICRLLSLPINS